ncbi:hypothetical protein DSO57_1024174 [Entomophthora muscae]|uniref:Uncharacterized protein n=1 Tax=Entomophthora muscae TaxID=34485 RepID=A0ACC2S4I1_9FUNG|nr:hypothetical protein DSO57_1024174 [Entomophthora muscae]
MDKNIQTDNIGSSLSCLAEQLNQAHYNILSSRMSTVARSILTFVIDGAQLYKGLGLVWRALALDAVNDRRAMHAASSAKAAFKKFTNSQSTNNVHSTLRLKYLAGASLLKARYIKIYQQISEWEGNNSDEEQCNDLSLALLPAPKPQYSIPHLNSSDFLFLLYNPPEASPVPSSLYLLQDCYY